MARVHGGAAFDLRPEVVFALGCTGGAAFDVGGAALMSEVPHLMAEVPHLLSVPNGLADWDETKGGRSMSQG
jgi:hypothetical protein